MKSSLPVEARLEMLVGHMWDTHAAMQSAVENLTVAPAHVKMRSELDFICELVGGISNKLVVLQEHMEFVLSELHRPQTDDDGRVRDQRERRRREP